VASASWLSERHLIGVMCRVMAKTSEHFYHSQLNEGVKTGLILGKIKDEITGIANSSDT